jgi:hypothetical protein
MTLQQMVTRPACRLALSFVVVASSAASGQQSLSDRLEFHGSLNAGYGRSHDLPTYGLPLTGTSDYRVFTLQGRYTISDQDQVVAQVFNRRLGTSPYATALADVVMQWAYYQHREGDFTFKVGRNPLPRGLRNEIRYIGTVLPFYRPPTELQGEAFDAIDGAVISYRHEIGNGIGFEQHGFGGGSENRNMANTSTGQELRIARTENMFGGQTYLTLPVAGVRLGAYAARYDFVQPTAKGYRLNTMFSGEATLDRLHLVTEHGRYVGHGPSNDNLNGYYEATVRLTNRLSVAGQKAYVNRMLFFANPDLNQRYMETDTKGASMIVGLTSNSVLKFEHHWRKGWAFDSPTPPVASQTATSVTFTPENSARYFLVSIAASF